MSTEITTTEGAGLVILAADIRREHAAAETSFRSAVEHAVRCGSLLLEAKAQVSHGAWLPWLAENFPGSARSAQGYMRLARNGEDAQALAHLGVEGALKQLAAPKKITISERWAEVDAAINEASNATRSRLALLGEQIDSDPSPAALQDIRDEAALIESSWREINSLHDKVGTALHLEDAR